MSDATVSIARKVARRVIPGSLRAKLYRRSRRLWPPPPIARLGTPRRLVPVRREFGASRGTPIDRYYIDDFLRRHSGGFEYTPGTIRGRVLEIGEDTYARRFGRGIECVDVLDASPENPR